MQICLCKSLAFQEICIQVLPVLLIVSRRMQAGTACTRVPPGTTSQPGDRTTGYHPVTAVGSGATEYSHLEAQWNHIGRSYGKRKMERTAYFDGM